MAEETNTQQASQPVTAAQPSPDTKPQEADPEAPIMAWEAKEFAQYSREKHWYLVVAVIGGLITLGALFFQQWTTAAVIALAAFVVIRHADDEPRTIRYGLTKLGVQKGNSFKQYNELKTFWIIYNPPVQTLVIQSTNRFKPLIKIDLANVDPLQVKQILTQYLPEETKKTEDFLDKFGRYIRL